MNSETLTPGSWRTHFLITSGVLFTVFLALTLAQLDSLQQQILPSPVAVAISNLIATPTNTPLPAIPLASSTPTPSATATSPAAQENTAVSVLPICDVVPPGWVLMPVPPGETLLTLSIRYRVSEEKIRLANCLEPDSLITANALYLPIEATPVPTVVCGPPIDWVHYTVRRGDTMFSLAKSRGTTIPAILNANCTSSTSLQAGMTIFLPPALFMPPTATAPPTATKTPTPTGTSTATATATATPTGTSTAPPLPTGSVTATNTPIGTATATPSTTPTATASPSQTPTASPTASATASPTIPATATPTPTSSATAPPSATPTPTPTASATPTNSPTPSQTPSSTPTATPTPTATAVPTDIPTP